MRIASTIATVALFALFVGGREVWKWVREH